MKKNQLFLLPALFLSSVQLSAQVTLDSTNLPIVGVYTFFQQIPDTLKITAFMGIIDKGYNVYNYPTDTNNFTYYDYIGIEQRGSISQAWWFAQKSYGLETRDSSGNNLDAVILGMPKENDWILYSPYDDRTLMHNVLTFDLVRQMGYYVSRTKYCELLLNTFLSWDYRGVYVMMEKIKRDKNRVNIAKLDIDDNAGDSLTGGYIFAVDKNIWVNDSGWTSQKDTGVFFTYKYPKSNEITPQQKNYIQLYVDSFETVMQGPNFADPATGYRKYIEPVSFMDFFIMQELSKNIDAYKRSAYLHKEKDSKGGKLRAGPHWDYNSAWEVKVGGCESFSSDTGWTYPLTCWVNQNYRVPFWWGKLLQDSVYANDLQCRWQFLRSGILSTANIFNKIDSIANYIAEAQVREYTRYGFTENYQNQVDSLKTWITKRLVWMDSNMPGNCWNSSVNNGNELENSFYVYPNPFSDEFQISSSGLKAYDLEIVNSLGKVLFKKTSITKQETIYLPVPSGIYFLKIHSENYTFTKKIARIE